MTLFGLGWLLSKVTPSVHEPGHACHLPLVIFFSSHQLRGKALASCHKGGRVCLEDLECPSAALVVSGGGPLGVILGYLRANLSPTGRQLWPNLGLSTTCASMDIQVFKCSAHSVLLNQVDGAKGCTADMGRFGSKLAQVGSGEARCSLTGPSRPPLVEVALTQSQFGPSWPHCPRLESK